MIDNQNNIGQRIRTARKQKGINQTELANLLGKSLRTIQKYESGEIEVSIAMINELAKALDTTSTFLIGYEHDEKNIHSLSDIMDFLFKLDRIKGLNFNIDVKRPPHYDEWECSITFNQGRTLPHPAAAGTLKGTDYAGNDHCSHCHSPRCGRHRGGAPIRCAELCRGRAGVPPGKPGQKGGAGKRLHGIVRPFCGRRREI